LVAIKIANQKERKNMYSSDRNPQAAMGRRSYQFFQSLVESLSVLVFKSSS